MHILLSNDDGIHADGLHALHGAVKDLGEITVVAPDSQRSAVGHAITLSDPIKCQDMHRDGQFFGHAVGGTPADSVKLAVCALLDEKPDLVVSGINLGSNAGIAIIYSGTVSAATEGTLLDIPSMAISLATFKNPIWDTAARVARQLTQHLTTEHLPRGTLLNVNVPNVPYDQLKGYAVTRMGQSHFAEVFDKRTDPRGNIYYWMDGNLEIVGDRGQTDLKAVEDGYISLTPIHFDLTRHTALDQLRDWKLKLGE